VRKKGERERKKMRERKKIEKEKIERESLEQKIQRDPCPSINKVRGVKLSSFYINLDKIMGVILIFYLFYIIYYSTYFHLTYFHLLSSYIYII